MNNRKIISVATIAFVLLTLTFGYQLYIKETLRKEASNTTLSVTLEIDYADLLPSERYEHEFSSGISVFEVTSFFAQLSTKNYSSLGVLVVGINGIISNVNLTNYYWFYYVDGTLADRACNLYFLETNSTISWKYESLST